jgi:hypothetical protein
MWSRLDESEVVGKGKKSNARPNRQSSTWRDDFRAGKIELKRKFWPFYKCKCVEER